MASGIWKRKSKKAMSLDSRKIPHQEPIEELVTRSASGSEYEARRRNSNSTVPLRSQLPLGQLFRHYLQWRREGQGEVERMQAKIDDMWLQEMMLGCDTELFETVRKAAEAVESGGEPLQALGRGLRAAEETEALALQSLHARLQARDCVRFAGGAEALEKRVRDTRAKAVQAVRPWIELLADRRQCHEVRKAMEVLLKETKEEYNSTLSMKTAKAEVVQELQDRSGQQEWTVKQLQDAVESLEETHLCEASSPMDLESFFVDTMSQSIPEDLGLRAVNCLEALVRCGNAAARALESVGRSPASPGDSSELLATSMEQSPEASNSHSTSQAIQIADVTLDMDPALPEVASPAEESAEEIGRAHV